MPPIPHATPDDGVGKALLLDQQLAGYPDERVCPALRLGAVDLARNWSGERVSNRVASPGRDVQMLPTELIFPVASDEGKRSIG